VESRGAPVLYIGGMVPKG